MKLRGALLYRCEGGPGQAFDERSAWKPSAVELSAQCGFLCRVTPALRKSHQIRYQGRTTECRELLDPPEQAKSNLLSKCPVFPPSVIYVKFFMWSKLMTPVEETKKTISDTYSTNRATSPCGNEYTSARTTENGSPIGLSLRS